MEKQKCPELRFSQFNNDWNETILGDVVDIVGGGTPDTNVPEFWNGDIDWYSPTEIGENVYANGSLKKITAAGLKNSSAKILPAKKTVLFSSRAGIGDMAILNKPAATNQGFQSFIAKNIDVYFLYSMGSKIKKFALSKASGSTFLEISRNQLAQMEFLAPLIDSDEQTQIGKFFQNLDQSIALHEKKLNQTQNLKKAMLEKMFPKAGSKQPEIRLKGFSGDWEQTTLGEIVDIYDGTHQTPRYTSSGIMFLSVENIVSLQSKKYISEEDFENDFSVFPVRNDILMTRIGDIGTANIVNSDEKLAYYVSLALLKPKKVNPEYLAKAISSEIVQKGIWRRTLHIAFPKKINKNEINNVEILVPMHEDEQSRIGNFFKQLDGTLALQQQQLQTLKSLKQAFLEKMFV